MTCDYESRCLNNHQCYRCQDYFLLKLPEDKQKKKVRNSSTRKDKSWQELEQRTAKQLNAVPTAREARRQSGSGNKWYAPGDVVDDVLLIEAKERDTLTTKGEKSLSIHREWLEKIANEARGTGRYPGVVFRFKGDDRSYAILEFNDLCELVHEVKLLREKIMELNKDAPNIR